jgi:hypothetical protein
MKKPQKKEPNLESNDIDGWRRVVKEKRLSEFSLEAIVAAIQDLGFDSDSEVIDALALHLSDSVMRILRRRVRKTYPNAGLDIIQATHDKLIDAVLSPQTADGKALRKAFLARLNFRLGDVIRAQERHEPPDPFNDESFDSENPSISEYAYVEEILSRIVDDDKRLAFRLHMEEVPVKSKRTMSISKALNKSDTTIETWIKEIQKQLKTIVEDRK